MKIVRRVSTPNPPNAPDRDPHVALAIPTPHGWRVDDGSDISPYYFQDDVARGTLIVMLREDVTDASGRCVEITISVPAPGSIELFVGIATEFVGKGRLVLLGPQTDDHEDRAIFRFRMGLDKRLPGAMPLTAEGVYALVNKTLAAQGYRLASDAKGRPLPERVRVTCDGCQRVAEVALRELPPEVATRVAADPAAPWSTPSCSICKTRIRRLDISALVDAAIATPPASRAPMMAGPASEQRPVSLVGDAAPEGWVLGLAQDIPQYFRDTAECQISVMLLEMEDPDGSRWREVSITPLGGELGMTNLIETADAFLGRAKKARIGNVSSTPGAHTIRLRCRLDAEDTSPDACRITAEDVGAWLDRQLPPGARAALAAVRDPRTPRPN
jgi:hypothetical protein